MSDIYKYKMLDIKVDISDFISYSCDAPVQLGIVIDRIKDVTKTLRTKDVLTLHTEHDPTDINSDNYISLKSNGLSRSVKLIDIKMVGEVPSLTGAELSLSKGFRTSVDSTPLRNFFKAASKAISFNVVCEDEVLNFTSKTEEGLVEATFNSEDIVLKPVGYIGNTQYSVKEVDSATSTMKGLTNVRGCNIEESGDGGLIELEWHIADKSTIRSLIAPRV
tara:strand:- start:1396 stop:2055 length:660 start_codon:yes stop_codon:yes gene_type:complete